MRTQPAKFLAWARQHMAPDPHVEPSLGDAYRISSLYLDTPALDVFCHRGSAARSKFRLRRYGDESAVYLERKRKKRDCVEKRRVPVLEAEMDSFKIQTHRRIGPVAGFTSACGLAAFNLSVR